MNTMNIRTHLRLGSLLMAATLLLTACGDDDDDQMMVPEPVTYRYSVTVTNLTNAQPFSPVAVALHEAGPWWQIGMPASDALATLAEGGDNAALLDMGSVMASASGDAPLPPGDSQTYEVSIDDNTSATLSVVAMLVNTNDGFTGLTDWLPSDLAVDGSMTVWVNAYDAGTEANSEAAGTIPGPADNGEGVSVGRETMDLVTMHPGVVSAEGGLSTSILMPAHRFDNPVAKITVTRVE